MPPADCTQGLPPDEAPGHRAHLAAWRIHEVAPDFRVEDVWALPTQGGPGELPRIVAAFVSDDFPEGAPLLVRVLWEARWRIGRLLGWDKRESMDSRCNSAPTTSVISR